MNIVFDLGGVVFDWQPAKIIQRMFEDPEMQKRVSKEVFGHPDWVELDRGTLTLELAVDRAAVRTGLSHGELRRLLHAVPRALTLKQETVDLIYSIKPTNNKLFVLSNMHLASITYLEQEHKFWHVFDGIVVSCRIQKVKPELAIYQHLLSQYGLMATETVFIDDLQENLTAAASLGIQTLQFVNASQCRQDLADLKCI